MMTSHTVWAVYVGTNLVDTAASPEAAMHRAAALTSSTRRLHHVRASTITFTSAA